MNFDDLVKQKISLGERVEDTQDIRHGAKDLETILNVVRKINTSLELSEVLELVTDEAIRFARAERGFIMLANAQGKLEYVVGRNNRGETIRAESFQVSSSVPEDVFRTGDSLCIENALTDQRFERRQSIMDLALQTIVCAPLYTPDEKIGVLYVDSRFIQAFDHADILYAFEILAGHAAIAIKNARLYADLKHTYEELKQANLHIIHYERMAMKGEIAAEISHELKNLVAIVLLSLQRLQTKIDSITPGELNRVIDTIIKGVKKIEGFSKSLLSRTRMTSRLVPLCLNKIVEDFVEFIRFLPRFKSCAISLAPDETLPKIQLDIDQLQQVLLNLMNNIVEARADSTITITTRYNRETQKACLCLKDNGPGIDESVLSKLFVERVTTKAEGHGYGLTVCKQIAENHGGTIQVESKKNEGTTFIITLPVVKEDEGSPERTS
ncbi:MAG: GAF domain-containing protein [Ignavibacteriae bacterium]|nr:GAF domain-containing protein [Ignavibacteriota bacterium]